jgi:long-chain acyl-CoA synthetase
VNTWPKVLASNCEKYPSVKAMRYKHYGIWHGLSWKDYYSEVKRFALGLDALGFEPGDRLLIIGEPAPQWHFAELAAQALHGVSVGVYPEASASEIRAMASETGARIIVCEDQEQVDKVLEMGATGIRSVIYWNYKGLAHYTDSILLGYRELLDLGKGSPHPQRFEERIAEGEADDVCALVYTSGASGVPRAAVHTYRSLKAGSDALLGFDPWNEHDEIVASGSPAWIMGQWTTIGCHLLSRCVLNFAEEPETRTRDTKEIEPTIAIHGARFWESLAAGLGARMLDLDAVKKVMFRLFLDGSRKPTFLADFFLLNAVRRALGLSRARICYSTGATLSPDALRLYHSLGIPVKSIYFTTEGGLLASDDRLLVMDARIESGEIVCKGPGAFLGYYNGEPLEDGWVRTGDAGRIDDGRLRFIDRKEDMVGSLAPQSVEASLRFSPFIKDAWVFAGGALIVINFPVVARWAGKKKIAFTTFAELARAPEVYDLVRIEVDRVNAGLPSSCRITAYANFHREFDPDAGEFTRSLSLRRRTLQERYAGIMGAFAAGNTSVDIDGAILTIRGVI